MRQQRDGSDTVVARDNEEYWIKRHENLKGQLAAVGNIGSNELDNLLRYARKKRMIVDFLRHLRLDNMTGLKVLDAGCGIGMISEIFHALGATVYGVDISSVALEEARHRCPGGIFQNASLLDFKFDLKFNVVCCFDVLYHVIDDANWSQVVARLADHVAGNGVLLLIDQVKPERQSPAPHVRFRTEAMYTEALGARGFGPLDVGKHKMFLAYHPVDRPA